MLQTAGTEEMDLQIWPSIYIYEFVKLGATILRAQCHISITCKPGFIIIIRLSQCPQMCRDAFFLGLPVHVCPTTLQQVLDKQG